MHTFLKIHRPVDIPGPLESEFPIIPVLYVGDDRYTLRDTLRRADTWLHRYRDPAGPTPGSPAADISGDTAGV